MLHPRRKKLLQRLSAGLLFSISALIFMPAAGSQVVPTDSGSAANAAAPVRPAAKPPVATPQLPLQLAALRLSAVDPHEASYAKLPVSAGLLGPSQATTAAGPAATPAAKQHSAAHPLFLGLGIAGSTVAGLDLAARAGAFGSIPQCGPGSPECSRHSNELLIGGLATAFVGFFFAFHHPHP